MFRSLKWLKNTHSLVEEYTACKRHGKTSSWWPLIKMMMMILMMMAMVMILMTIMVLITMMTHDKSHDNDDNGERVNLWRNEIGRPNHPTAWKLEVSKLKQILWVKICEYNIQNYYDPQHLTCFKKCECVCLSSYQTYKITCACINKDQVLFVVPNFLFKIC